MKLIYKSVKYSLSSLLILILGCGGSIALAVPDATEQSDLLYMREEEKLAHDLYDSFYQLWGSQIFSNISSSESQHASAVLNLLNLYGLNDPAANLAAGVFSNQQLQAQYDQLLAQGSVSELAALEAAISVEQADIADLDQALLNTDEALIIRVYSNLRKGSSNHLSAFTTRLEALGGSAQNGNSLDPGTAVYEPISQTLYIPAIDVTDSKGQTVVYDAMLKMVETLPQTLELVAANPSTRLPSSEHASYVVSSGLVDIPKLRVGALSLVTLEQTIYKAQLERIAGSNPQLFSINFVLVAD